MEKPEANSGVKTVFIRDYTTPELPEQFPSELELLSLARALLQSPRLYCVDDRAAQQFYLILWDCDQLAKAFSGRIRATLDYDLRSAELVLESMTLEFDDRQRSEVLHEIAAKAHYVRISAIPDGFFRIYALMPYFKPY